MSKILIIGLTGGGDVGMYERQLGNVAILIPMIQSLKSYIPEAEISTTIQLTDSFCMEHGVTRIPNPRKLLPYFDGGLRLLLLSVDLFRACLWRSISGLLHLNIGVLIR